MAQTGYTPILIYSSSTTSNVPAAGSLTNSTLGSELAINITDGKLFYKDNANAVQVIGWKVVPTTAGGTGLTSYTAGDLMYYASGTTFTKLAIGASGNWLGSSGTAPQWNAPAALTKTDDTNVTLTLGGSASTALLNAASLTLGWTGTLAVSRGGTGTGTAFTAGSVLFAGASGVYSQDNTNFFWDDANNRLGLGVATPTDRLHVYNGIAKVESTNANATSSYFLQTSPTFTGGSQSKDALVVNTGTRDTKLGLFTNSGGQFGAYLNLTGSQDAGFQIQFAGSAKQTWFPSGGTSINTTTDPGAGNVLVSGIVRVDSASLNATDKYFYQTSPAFNSGSSTKYSFYTESGTSSPKTLALGFISDVGGSQGAYINTLNTNIGLVIQNGSADGVRLATGGTSWSSYSDEKLKTIIEPIINAKQKMKMLRTVIGRYNTDKPEKRRPFFIAQDMQKALPEAVDDETDFLEIRYTDTIPLVAAAINELIDDIEKINAKLGI